MKLSCQTFEFGLTWEKVIAVCFDGTGSMSWRINGLQAIIMAVNHFNKYVHCFESNINLFFEESESYSV